MSYDLSASAVTPVLSTDLLSGAGSYEMSGASQAQKIKAVSKAMEGIFVSQLMSEIGEGLGGTDKSQQPGLYQDFIQQALSQQVASGGGFGLARFLENSLTPAHEPVTPTASSHAHGPA